MDIHEGAAMTMTASEAKSRFGQLLDSAQREPVEIEKNGRPFAVMLSKHDYDALQRQVQELRSEIETAHLLRGGNRERLLSTVKAHQAGRAGIDKTTQELDAMAGDAD